MKRLRFRELSHVKSTKIFQRITRVQLSRRISGWTGEQETTLLTCMRCLAGNGYALINAPRVAIARIAM